MREVVGEPAEWSIDTHLLAYACYLLAGANWQRGGGKGQRPKLIRPRNPQRRGSGKRNVDGAAVARRLANLGLLPGHQPAAAAAPLTPQQQRLAAALQTAQQQQDPTHN